MLADQDHIPLSKPTWWASAAGLALCTPVVLAGLVVSTVLSDHIPFAGLLGAGRTPVSLLARTADLQRVTQVTVDRPAHTGDTTAAGRVPGAATRQRQSHARPLDGPARHAPTEQPALVTAPAAAPQHAAAAAPVATAAAATSPPSASEQTTVPAPKRTRHLSLARIASTTLPSGARQLNLRFAVSDNDASAPAPAPEIIGFADQQSADQAASTPTAGQNASSDQATDTPGDSTPSTPADTPANAGDPAPAEPGVTYVDVTLTVPAATGAGNLTGLRLVVDMLDASTGAQASAPDGTVTMRVRLEASDTTAAAPTSAETPQAADSVSNAVEILALLPADGQDAPAADGQDTPAADGEDAPTADGEDAPAADGEDAPAANGQDAPAGGEDDSAPTVPIDPEPTATAPDSVQVIVTIASGDGEQGSAQTASVPLPDPAADVPSSESATVTVAVTAPADQPPAADATASADSDAAATPTG